MRIAIEPSPVKRSVLLAVEDEGPGVATSERTRIFVLCNPHNPVGRVFRRDELEAMAEIASHIDKITVVGGLGSDALSPLRIVE